MQNILKQLIGVMKRIIGLQRILISVKQFGVNATVFKKAKECIGKDLAKTHDELGCAEAVNEVVFKALGKSIDRGVSTFKMIDTLKDSKRFKRVYSPIPGDIIISPTGYGGGRLMHGHVGIVSDNNKIMSNNSSTYKWDEHFNRFTWKYRYQSIGKFPIYYYRIL